MLERSCRQCGADLQGRHATAVLCGSEECGRKDRAAYSREQYARGGRYYARSNQPKGKCSVCAKPVHIRKGSAANPTCRDCQKLRPGYKGSISAAFPPAPHICARCGVESKRKPSKYDGKRYCLNCSKWNTIRRDVDKRRARRAAKLDRPTEKYTTAQIAARDNYRCGICKLIVHMFLSGLHDRGPTIDHITPLAKGGSDTRDNVQLAHRICNMRKGVRME